MQRGFVLQAVVHADADAAIERRLDDVEHPRVDEARQGKNLGDMPAQPVAVFGLDAGIEVDVHFIDDIAAHIATSPIAMLARIAKLSRIV